MRFICIIVMICLIFCSSSVCAYDMETDYEDNYVNASEFYNITSNIHNAKEVLSDERCAKSIQGIPDKHLWDIDYTDKDFINLKNNTIDKLKGAGINSLNNNTTNEYLLILLKNHDVINKTNDRDIKDWWAIAKFYPPATEHLNYTNKSLKPLSGYYEVMTLVGMSHLPQWMYSKLKAGQIADHMAAINKLTGLIESYEYHEAETNIINDIYGFNHDLSFKEDYAKKQLYTSYAREKFLAAIQQENHINHIADDGFQMMCDELRTQSSYESEDSIPLQIQRINGNINYININMDDPNPYKEIDIGNTRNVVQIYSEHRLQLQKMKEKDNIYREQLAERKNHETEITVLNSQNGALDKFLDTYVPIACAAALTAMVIYDIFEFTDTYTRNFQQGNCTVEELEDYANYNGYYHSCGLGYNPIEESKHISIVWESICEFLRGPLNNNNNDFLETMGKI